MSDHSTNNWNDEIEILLNKLRKNCVELETFHKEKYFGLKKIVIYFQLPIIILSSINALVAVSLTEYLPQNIISGTNAGISFIIGTLTSIGMYLKINDRMESELDASKSYHKLGIDIFKVLSLKVSDRNTDGDLFLNQVYQEYIKLFERSNLINDEYSDRLKIDLPIGVSSIKIISTD